MQKGIETLFFIIGFMIFITDDPTAEMQKGIETHKFIARGWLVSLGNDPTAEMQKGIETFRRDFQLLKAHYDPTAEMQKGIETLQQLRIPRATLEHDPTAEMQKGIETMVGTLPNSLFNHMTRPQKCKRGLRLCVWCPTYNHSTICYDPTAEMQKGTMLRE